MNSSFHKKPDKPILKISKGLPVSKLKEKLLNNPNLFGTIDNRLKDNGPHRESSDIWVRYGDYENIGDSVFIEEHDSIWYPVLDEIPWVADIAFNVMSKVRGERLGGVLITRLEPGKKVYKHKDLIGWHPEYYDKYFVPIANSKGAEFCFDGQCVDPDEGDLYWFRNDVDHWVNNGSDSVRIAMVVCIKPFEDMR